LNLTHEQIADGGGGYFRLLVRGTIERGSQGDAEWWAREKLLDLAESGVGDLSVNGYKHLDCVFVAGQCTVRAFKYAEYWYEFWQSLPERDASLGAGEAPPGDEAEYPLRGTQDIYHLAGADMGILGRLAVSARRQPIVKKCPPAFGVTFEDLAFGAQLELRFNGWQHHDTHEELMEWCWNLQTLVGYQETQLEGCGNTWSNVFLMDVSPDVERDVRGLSYSANLIQQCS